jgi:uncharacterized membrane protein
MTMDKKLAWVWLGILVFEILFLSGICSQLPPVVATHFDAVGNPNGYQTKGAFISTFLLAIGFSNGLLALFFFLMAKIPPERMNLPNKAFWLSTPENRALIQGKLRLSLTQVALFMNTALLFGEQVIYQQNVPTASLHVSILWGLIIILVLAVCMMFISFLNFRTFTRPPDSPP